MQLGRWLKVYLPLVLCLVVYGMAQQRLTGQTMASASPELLISLPRFAQVLLAAGDRHLAANLAGFRVLVADTGRMKAADYAVQGRLQRDIAWFNPLHEDNFYIGAAILPWNGQVDAAQYVLGKASAARIFDWYPLFHYAFIHYHFRKDPATGARYLLEAMPRAATPQDQWALQSLAAAWIEKGYRTASAAGMVRAMAANTPPGGFRVYLEGRAKRLQDLVTLQDAATRFADRHGRRLASLQELVDSGLIAAIPSDPFGYGFSLDVNGWPMLNTQAPASK
ncbi:MAG TPA: hypothetical protein PLS39_09565 [Accumulibacter sp.]|nr:hypothetical protein [Accumulibacter sp.]HMW17991.1 hypothetical protein [Accumulibacter sp.]HMX22671.1 hypothetical protein [Accumulibacter sp.]HMY06537.1 hypothetical protein [Accumulibacter sp.]HNC18068.1 hypothetical protein [Accumulibacter sp.]